MADVDFRTFPENCVTANSTEVLSSCLANIFLRSLQLKSCYTSFD